MSFLDGLLGKSNLAGGTDALGSVQDLIRSQGGVEGLAQKFGGSGLSDVAASWIGKGNNLPISAKQIESVLGSGPIGQIAERLGVSPAQAASALSVALPMIIDRLTPDGDAANAKEGVDAGDILGGLLGSGGGGLGSALGGLLKR